MATGAAIAGVALSAYQAYEGYRSQKKRASALDELWQQKLREAEANRGLPTHTPVQMFDPYKPIRENLIQEAMKNEPLHYAQMRDQISQRYGMSERAQRDSMAQRGLTGSGIDAALGRGQILRQAKDLSLAYQQGLMNRLQLKQSLLGLQPGPRAIGGGEPIDRSNPALDMQLQMLLQGQGGGDWTGALQNVIGGIGSIPAAYQSDKDTFGDKKGGDFAPGQSQWFTPPPGQDMTTTPTFGTPPGGAAPTRQTDPIFAVPGKYTAAMRSPFSQGFAPIRAAEQTTPTRGGGVGYGTAGKGTVAATMARRKDVQPYPTFSSWGMVGGYDKKRRA